MYHSNNNISAVACAALLFMTSGFAVQAADYGTPTNLPGIISAPEPPAGFDPVKASDQELDAYGFPPRPDLKAQPQAYAGWERAMRAARHRIVPVLQHVDHFHGPVHTADPEDSTGTSANWSGVVVDNGLKAFNPSTSFRVVSAEFVVPVANQAFGKCTGGWDYSATWVGIDGFGGDELLQAGTESDALCIHYMLGQYYAWFEYFESRLNNPSVKIMNLPVVAGDDMLVTVFATSAIQGQAFLENLTSGQFVSIGIPMNGTPFIGHSVEWVVERPTVNGQPSTLTNYASDYFSNCIAATFGGALSTPGSPSAMLLTMLDNNSQPISAPTMLGTMAIRLDVEGSAR
jgi:hypothetical protein